MNRGRLRRRALRVVAAVALAVGVVVTGGVANAAVTPDTAYGRVLPGPAEASTAFEVIWT
jgi:hypothetical protein